MRNLIKKSVSLLLAFTMVFGCNGMTTLAETITTTSEPVASSSPSGMEVVEESDVKYEVGLVQSGHGSIQFTDTDSATKKLPPGSSVSLVITPANGWYLDYVIDSDTGDVVWQGDGNTATVTTPDRAFYLEPVFARGTKQKSSSSASSSSKNATSSSGGIDTDAGQSSETKEDASGIVVETPVDNADTTTEEKAPDMLEEDDGIVVETPVEEETKKNRSTGDSVAKANNQYAVIGTANALPFYMGQGGFRSGPVSDIHGLVGPYGGRESGVNFDCYLIRNHEKSDNVYYWYRNAGTMLINDKVTRVSVQVFPWVTCVEATENTERKETDDDHYFWLRTAMDGVGQGSLALGSFGGTAQFNDRYYQRYHRIFDSSVARVNGDGTDIVNKLDDSHACLLHLAFKFYDANTGAQIPNASGMVWFNDLDSGLGWWQEGVLGERGNCLGFVTGMSAIEPQTGFMTGTLDHGLGSIDFAAAGIGFVADGDTFGMVYQSPRGSFASNISFVSTNLSYKFLPYETSDGRVIWPTKKTNNGVVQYDENLMYDELLPYAGGNRNNHSLVLSRYVDTSTDDAAYLFGSVPLPGYEFEGWFANNNNVTTPYHGVPSMADNVELRGRYVPITGGLLVHKTVQNLSPSGLTTLQNMFSFRLTGTSLSGAPVDMTVSTDSNGNAEFTDVPISDPEGTGYTLTEVFNAGEANWEPRQIRGIQITRDTVRQVSVENVYKTGSVKVIKDVQNDTNFGHKTKDGFTFVLTGTSNDGRSITKTSVATTESGVVEFTEVPFGTYTLREEGRNVTTPVSGFETNNGIWNVTYQGGNQVVVNTAGQAPQSQTKTVVNRMPSGKIRVYKTIKDPTGRLSDLAGELRKVRFSVYSNSGDNVSKEVVSVEPKNVSTVSSPANNGQITGYVEFPNLPAGTYTIREENALDSSYQRYWKLSNVEQVKQVTDGGSVDVTFTDTFKEGGLTIQKHITGLDTIINGANAPSNPLAGFKFSVKSVSDDIYGGMNSNITTPINTTITTDRNGQCSLNHLPIGTYDVKEIEVPSWYTNNGLTYNFETRIMITSDQTVPIHAYNNYDTGDIQVVKHVTDASSLHDSPEGFGYILTGTSLSGEEVNVPATYTGPDGTLVFRNVPVGNNYTVTEVSVPGSDTSGIPSYWKCDVTSQSAWAKKDEMCTVDFYNTFKTGSVTVLKDIVDNSGILDTSDRTGYAFRLYGTSDAGDLIDKIETTGVAGLAAFDNIPVGTYQVEEVALPGGVSITNAPDTWKVASPKSVSVVGFENASVVLTNTVNTWYPKVKKTVSGNEAETNVAGFSFRLHGFVQIGTQIREITVGPKETDENGEIYFGAVPVGQWTVEEVAESLPDYYKNPGAQSRKITKADAGQTIEFTFDNVYKTGVIEVIKKVTDSKEGVTHDLSGFRFRLRGITASGKRYTPDDLTTNSRGAVVFSDVPVGTYSVEEIGADNRDTVGSWWVKAEKEEGIDVLEDSRYTCEMENIYKRGNVKVVKDVVDPTGANPSRAGFKFTLTGTSESGEDVSEEAVTDGEGVALFSNIPVGSHYTVTEVGTPDTNGESISDAWSPRETSFSDIVVSAEEDGTPITTEDIHFQNTYRTGNLTVDKVIVDNYHNTYGLEPLSKAGFKFRITSKLNESLFYEAVTNEEGKARWENIPVGEYTLEEVATPDGGNSVGSWWTVSDPQTVVITYDDTHQLQGEAKATITNTYETGKIIAHKKVKDLSNTITNTDGTPKLDGYVFMLSGSSLSGEEVRQWKMTTSDGSVTFYDIPLGHYSLTEVKALGYTEPIEVQGPTSYWDVSPFSTDVTVDGETVPEPEITNTFKTGNVKVVKVIIPNTDNEGVLANIPKAGFQFRLSGKSLAALDGLTQDVNMLATTDEDGYAVFENVPLGSYTVSEVGTEQGELDMAEWWTPAENQTVDVKWNFDDQQEPVTISMTNSLDTGAIKVVKTVEDPSDTHTGRAGFKFRLTGTTKSGIELTPVEQVTNENGETIFRGIPVGSNYKIEEIATPGKDYIEDTWDVVQPVVENIEVVKNQETPVEVPFTNIYKTGSLEVKKVVTNLSNYGVKTGEGFVFKLTSKADSTITYTETSNESGIALFENLPIGEYTLSEIAAPDGVNDIGSWWKPAEDQDVTITYTNGTTDRQPVRTTMENLYKVGDIHVTKTVTDSTGRHSGTEGYYFMLTGRSDSGEDVQEWAQTGEGVPAVFKNIPVGSNYTVTEVKAMRSMEPFVAETDEDALWDVRDLVQTGIVVGDSSERNYEPTQVEVENIFKTGSVRVIKLINFPDNLDPAIVETIKKSGFTFRLHGKSLGNQDSSREDVDMTMTTDDDGYAVFEDVPIGTYILTEVGTDNQELENSSWWTLADDVQVEVRYDQQTDVPMTNGFDTGSIKVWKAIEDPTGRHGELADFGFRLTGTTASGVELPEMIRYTDDDGTCTFDNIPVGTEYTITEISTPGSDAIDDAWYPVQPVKEHIVVEKGKITGEVKEGNTKTVFTNIYKTGQLVVHNTVINEAYKGMTNNESDPVPKTPDHFCYKIVGQNEDGTLNENLKYEAETDENGFAVFPDLPIGKYVVTEIATSDGNGHVGDWWVVDGDGTVVDVAYDNGDHDPSRADVEFTNTYKLGDLNVQKELADAPDQLKTLSGFVFLLEGTSQSGKHVKVWSTSNGDGLAEFVNIPIGTYALTEVSALGQSDQLIVAGPESYWDVQPRYQRVEIVYDDTTQAASARVKNIYKSGKLAVKKVIDNDSVYDDPSLEGFTFELTGTSFGNGAGYSDVNHVTATTNADGIAIFENIPIGDQLTLKEVGTNKDNTHKIDAWWDIPDEREITITYDEMPVYEMHNIYKTGNLKVIKKIDDQSTLMDDRLDGFKFHLYGTSDGGSEVNLEGRTNHEGIYIFRNVPIGTYTIEEVASPGREDMDPLWNSDGLKQEVRIDYDDTIDSPEEKTFTNTYATGNLVVTKQLQNKSAYGVHDKKNFVFRLTRLTDEGELDERFVYEEKTGTKTGQLVGTIRIKDEQAVFENIPVGRYKLTEVDTPEEGSMGVGSWWTVTTDPEDGIVTIEHDNTTNDQTTKHATVTNVYKVGNVEMHKDITDPSNTYKTRSGFIFRLTGISESGEHVDMTAETDGEGYALFENVPVGTHYLVTETKIFNDDTDIENTGPDFYWDIQPRTQYVDVEENITTGQEEDVRINNIYKTGDLVVQKDITNPALNHETPYGVSEKNKFTFRLHGKSYKNQNLDYEDIDLYATTGDDWITYGTNWEVTTHDGVEGEAHFAGIPIGTYTLEEVNVPDYTNGIPTWWEPTLSQTVNITYGDKKVIPWMNRYKTGDIEVHKVVEDPSGLAEGLEGFVFKLEGTSESGVDVVEVESTNKYGIAQFVDIPIGKNYKIYEIGTPEDASNIPEWWDNTEASEGRGRSVEIVDKQTTDSGEAEIPVEEFTNVYKTGSVKVTKLIREASFNDGISREYFAFRMTGTSLSGKEIEKYAITDDNGDAFFEDVPIGDNYTIEEVSKKDVQDAANAGNREAQKIAHLKIHTLEGYITQEPLRGVEVEYNTERHLPKETTVTFSNEQTKTMINIMDYDTDVELDDVYLRIKNTETNDTVVYSLKTVHENNNIIYGLTPGQTYTVTEIRPRPGYAFNLYEKDGYRSKYADMGFTFENEVYDGVDLDPTISETDPNEATFTVQDVSGVQIVSLFNKPVQSKLTVEKKGEVISTQIRNEELNKYRYVIKGLPNAEYTVRTAEDIKYLDGYTYAPYMEKDTVVARLTTDENGEAVTDPLYLGKYEIEETAAPRGYYLDASKSKQVIDLFEEYMQSNYNPGQTKKEKYAEEVVGASASFTNERQIIDIGNDPDPGDIPFDDPRDPTQEHYTHAGVYKIGVDGAAERYVAGAEFTLYAAEDIIDPFGNVSIPKDTKIETAVSGEDGRAQFHTDLPVGKYYVKETNAPDGYYSSKAQVVFDTSTWEENDEVEFIRMTGEIRNAVTSTTVFLKDDKTLNELAGASLKVTDPDGKVVDAWITTNTDGSGYVIKGLDPGVEYTLTEVIPRDGYTNNIIIPEDMKDKLTPAGHNVVKFTIPDEELSADLTDTPESYEITILNRFITGSVIVSKEGEVLESAQNLWSKHQFVGQIIDWVKTVFSFGGRGTKDVEFTIYADENIYHPDGVTGLLYKKDQPVKIKVRSSNDDAVLVTDETGKVLFDEMFLGKFYVMETNHPDGYITNTSKVPFSLVVKDFVTDEVWADTNVDFVNTRQKVSIKVNKADEEDHTKVLSGAVFGLYTREDIKNADGTLLLAKNSLVETQETDVNGVAVFEADLPLGKYLIREEAAPAGYVMNDSEIFVDATWKENGPEYLKFSYNVYNEKSKVYIDKLVSVTGERLHNVDLGVYLGSKEIERWTTTGKSHLIEGLTIGQTYTLKELKAPAGYATAKDVTFTVEEPTDEIQQVVMKDDPIRIEIQTWSVNKNGKEKELEGVKMHLETKDGAVVTIDGEDLRWTSETSPTNWDKVPAGEYVIVVDSVSEGCVKPDPTPITVEDTPELQHFDVKVPTINVDVIAVDSNTNEPLNGVVVTIYDEDKKPVYEHVDLEFIKDKVPAGNYTVEVEDVPEGYVTPPPFDMVVEEKPETQNFVIPIDPTTVVINAVDSKNNNPVEDVVVTVYDKDGNPVREHVPLEYATTKLEPGDYTIHVDSVPDGYVKPTEDTPITVKDTSEKQVFTIPIDPIDIYIKAIDKVTGEEMIKNVYVTVYDKDGHKLFNNVPLDYAQEHVKPGEYTIHVNEVPEGYIIPDDMHITVKQQKGTQTFIVPVEYIKTAYEVLDDKTGKPVEGVKMHLVGADGKTYATWTSEKGWTYKDKILAGDYKIVVDSVPKGYAIPAPKAITIKSIADLQKFIIKLKAAEAKDKTKTKAKKSDKNKSKKKSGNGKGSNGSGNGFTRNGGSNGLTKSAKTWDILFLVMLGASVVLGLQFFDRREKKKKKSEEGGE